MLLDITLPESTVYTWVFIIVILLIIISNWFNNNYKKTYEQKTAIDKEELNKKIAEYQLNTAKLKEQATQWGLAELEKFKQNELEAQTKIINDNAIGAAKNVLARWMAENEDRIRKDAANRSVRNVLGKVTEHLIPFSEAMKQFNPKDIRFIGSPIDLIVFDGAEELRNDISIHFIEVKTGTSALSKRQQLIKDAIQNRRIHWMRVNMKDFGDDVNEALKQGN